MWLWQWEWRLACTPLHSNICGLMIFMFSPWESEWQTGIFWGNHLLVQCWREGAFILTWLSRESPGRARKDPMLTLLDLVCLGRGNLFLLKWIGRMYPNRRLSGTLLTVPLTLAWRLFTYHIATHPVQVSASSLGEVVLGHNTCHLCSYVIRQDSHKSSEMRGCGPERRDGEMAIGSCLMKESINDRLFVCMPAR